MDVIVSYNVDLFWPRWHSWIAQSPPKGQVAGSNPAWGTNHVLQGHKKMAGLLYKQAAQDYVMLYEIE